MSLYKLKGFLAIIISIFIIIPQYSFSQADHLKFDHLNTQDGLSHSSVLNILQDSYGFIWFGTYSGLNRYDGYTFKVFRHELGKFSSISSNAVIALHEDREGYLWIGTLGGGLSKYNPVNESFEHYYNLNSSADNTSPSNINVLFEDSDGFLWVGSSQGLFKYNRNEDKFEYFEIFDKSQPNKSITAIYEGYTSKLWIGCTYGLKKIDRENKSYEACDFNTDLLKIEIHAIYEDQKENLWVGTKGNGLIIVDIKRNEKTENRKYEYIVNNIDCPNVFDIVSNQSGDIWIATDNGLYIVNAEKGEFYNYRQGNKNPANLSNNLVRDIYKDNSGNMWIGTDGGGINKVKRFGSNFNTYRSDINNIQGHSTNNIFAIEKDVRNNLWIGTYGGGLDLYEPSGQFKNYKLENKLQTPANKILSLDAGPTGNLWIGTDEGGLYLMPGNISKSDKPHFINFSSEKFNNNSLSSNICYSVMEDNEGNVWVGTFNNGLNKLDFKDDKFYRSPTITRYMHDKANDESISSNNIFKIYQDKHDVIWIGTLDRGLNKLIVSNTDFKDRNLEHKTETFEAFLHDPEDSMSISDNGIFEIFESKNGDFWIGTATGLNKMDRKKGTFNHYTDKDGLVNNVVFGILEDRHGNLWLGTHGGISCFNPTLETFINYTIADGIAGNVFNPDAFCCLPGGAMFFGGPNGLTSFVPENFKYNPVAPKVVLLDFKLHNKSVKPGDLNNGRELLLTSIFTTKEIKLSHKQNNITFEFSTNNHTLDSKNKYAYKLTGMEEDWNYTDASQRFCNYNNLPPGTYTLQLKAANPDGVWSVEPTKLIITIEPPFWNTLFLKIVFAIILLIVVVFSIKTYLKNMGRRRKKDLIDQERKFEMEQLYKEKELIRLKNEKLDEALRNKNKELGITATNIVKQNNKIELIKKSVSSLKPYIVGDGEKELKKLIKTIDQDLNDNEDWHLFERSFNDLHSNYLNRLADSFPELTHVDLKFCACMRMNLSNKEICNLFNISLRGLETARLRIRKRINVPKDENLNDFILKF